MKDTGEVDLSRVKTEMPSTKEEISATDDELK
jgi:hypothetical protein